MLNKEVFAKDPTTYTLPNDGVAKLAEITDAKAWDVARYEVEHFVCEGMYHEGLRRILESFLGSLGQPTQRAVWVHGFYGSGKSHLVRVLEFLWRDLQFPDGVTARGLAHLPEDVVAPLKELSTAGLQRGGLWSAAGTLGANSSHDPRHALLGVVLRAAGLPERIDRAQFDLWLLREGWYDRIVASLREQGRSYARENFLVSIPLAEQLLTVNAGFANSTADALKQLRAQFPNVSEVGTDLMADMMRQVFELKSTHPDRLPCILLVLDELQQYLADDQDRTAAVQEAVEACVSRFESGLLFVATGQSALQATPILQKLQGRFSIPVALRDTDVEKVLRQTVLRKKPAAAKKLASLLDLVSGEISRHLGGSEIAATSSDHDALVSDYPLLPTRRRFWERVLRAVDTGGTTAQLRTQLRLAHEAARAVADQPLGYVVGADFIFEQQQTTLLQTAELPRKVDAQIAKQKDCMEEGELRSRLCALIFLIGKLDASVGLRANADTLADLLVTDLPSGSAAVRQKVPGLLNLLYEAHAITLLEDEYRIQTEEGAEWDDDYRRREARLRGDDAAISTERSERVQMLVRATLQNLNLTQGTSKPRREYELHFGATPPVVGAKVPVWVRTGWDVREADVKREAAAAGQEDATVYVFIARPEQDTVRPQIAGFLAARDVPEGRPVPTTDEGRVAKAGMEGRQTKHDATVSELLVALIEQAKVFQSGGAEVTGFDFRAMVELAGNASVLRLFPRFGAADSARWDRVADRVKQGAADALHEVGHDGDAAQHPVCREVLSTVGEAGKTGTAVWQVFQAPPFGWSRDAVTGSLMVLTTQGYLSAKYRGAAISGPELDLTKCQQAEFRRERRVIPPRDLILLRGLYQQAGIPCVSGQEALKAPDFLLAMKQLAEAAGGDPPLPARPSTVHLGELQAMAGNEQLAAILENKEELLEQLATWKTAGERAADRVPRWTMLQRLLTHSAPLPVHEEVRPELQAVLAQRSLLSDPDPVPPLVSRTAEALRKALNGAHADHTRVFGEKLSALEKSETWRQLAPEKQQEILGRHGLAAPAPLQVGSDAQLLASLDAVSLQAWADRTAALSERFRLALEDAVRELQPKAQSVRLPAATVATPEELDAYLEAAKKLVRSALKKGPVILP